MWSSIHRVTDSLRAFMMVTCWAGLTFGDASSYVEQSDAGFVNPLPQNQAASARDGANKVPYRAALQPPCLYR